MQLKKYYQPRKSHRIVSVNMEGNKVPLYGAGSGITIAPTGGKVPLTLNFQIRSRGDVVGKLVRVKHRRQISCPLVIDSSITKPIKFKKNSCTFEWWWFHLLHLILKSSSDTVWSICRRISSSPLVIQSHGLLDLYLQGRRKICIMGNIARILQINVFIMSANLRVV